MKDKVEGKCSKKSYSEMRAEEKRNGTQYKLRTEFRHDCLQILCLLRPWVLSWKESPGLGLDDSHVDDDGRIWSSQDCGIDFGVEFIIAEGGPTLKEIRWLINAIVDCHVAAQTVSERAQYTGKRIDYELFDDMAMPPSPQVIRTAIEAIKEQQESLAICHERSMKTIDRLDVQLGDDEPYKRRTARSTANCLLAHHLDNKIGIDPVRLEEYVYRSIVVDRDRGTVKIQLGQ